MITLTQTTKKSELADICNILSVDAEGMRRLAFYEDAERWAQTFTSQRQGLLASIDGKNAGFIDLEFDNANSQVVLSYYLAPEFRGQGYAKDLLACSLTWLKEHTVTRVVFAYIDAENLQSIRAICHANFRYETKRQGMLCFVTIIN